MKGLQGLGDIPPAAARTHLPLTLEVYWFGDNQHEADQGTWVGQLIE